MQYFIRTSLSTLGHSKTNIPTKSGKISYSFLLMCSIRIDAYFTNFYVCAIILQNSPADRQDSTNLQQSTYSPYLQPICLIVKTRCVRGRSFEWYFVVSIPPVYVFHRSRQEQIDYTAEPIGNIYHTKL